MRVLHVITRLILGGAQENTIASVLGVRQKTGWDVTLISGPSRGAEGSLEKAFDARPELLTHTPHLVRPIQPWHDALALRDLTELFRRRQPDVIHTHSGKAGVLGRLAAHRARVPIVVHTIHGPSFGRFQGPIANRAFTLAERVAGRHTTHFVSVCDAMTRQYQAAGIGQPGQFTTIYSGFELGPFLQAKNDPAVRARLGLAPEDFVVGKIARLTALKGHDDLLAVAPAILKQFPNTRFLLVGDGDRRQELEAKTRIPELRGRFVFAGLVPPEKIPQLAGVMDMLVHLSAREGLARALPQALAAGRPVVAYDLDGANEVCRTDETGFLVRAGDLDTLAHRIGDLARDPLLRESLGSRGRERVRQTFSVDRMIDQLHALYLRLAAARGTSASG